MNPVALLVLQMTVAVKSPVQFSPLVECFLALSCCPQCETAPAPSPFSKGGAFSDPAAAAVRQPGRLLELPLGGPKALRPRLTTGLPFSPAHKDARAGPHLYR